MILRTGDDDFVRKQWIKKRLLLQNNDLYTKRNVSFPKHKNYNNSKMCQESLPKFDKLCYDLLY